MALCATNLDYPTVFLIPPCYKFVQWSIVGVNAAFANVSECSKHTEFVLENALLLAFL